MTTSTPIELRQAKIDKSSVLIYNVNMKLKFVWDERKALENLRKHKVSFDEAKTIFLNLPLQIFHDPDHSDDEDRYLAFGFSDEHRALLVVHLENNHGTEIRLISARKATKNEMKKVFGG